MTARPLVVLMALAVGVVSGTAPAGAQAATGSIAGNVVGPDGAPLAGVCVEALADEDTGGYAQGTTGSDGSFLLEGLPAGAYRVGFNTCGDPVPGSAPELYLDARTVEQSTPVSVAVDRVTQDVDAALEATGSFSGTVVDDDSGDPVEGICVLAFTEETGAFGEATTAADGTYRVADLPAGEYTVGFGDCADPFVHVSEVYDDVQISGGEPTGEPELVAVASGEDTGGIDAGLVEGGAVEGVVTGQHTAKEQPLVCVALFEADAAQGAPPAAVTLTGVVPSLDGQAASPGTFVLGGVVPGDYVLVYNPVECADTGYLTRFYDAELTRADADVVSIGKGESVRGLDAVMTPQPSIDFACPFQLGAQPASFSDVPEVNVHRRAIECLAVFDVVLGRSDGTYAPAAPVTRAQLASFVARTLEASGVTLPANPPDAFDDDNGDVHEMRINQIAAVGVVRGKGGRIYAPAETVGRAQMATFLVNAYQSATGNELLSSGDRFTDDEGNVHEASIDRAAAAGITAGTGSGYAPNGIVRRDAMASFLARLLDRSQRDLAVFLPGEGEGEGGGEASTQGLARMSVTGDAPARWRPSDSAPFAGSLRQLVEAAAGRAGTG